MKNLSGLKKWIDTNQKIPSKSKSADDSERFYADFLFNQRSRYEKKSFIMANEKYRNIWSKFV